MADRDPPAFPLPITITIEDEGRAWDLQYSGERLLTIGRSPECDIVLDAPKASRQHAEIFGEGGRFTILDTTSSNGTRLNGQRIRREPLNPGDVIEIGRSRLVFGKRAERTVSNPDSLPEVGGAGDVSQRSHRSAGSRAAVIANRAVPVILLAFLGVLMAWFLQNPDLAEPASAPEKSAAFVKTSEDSGLDSSATPRAESAAIPRPEEPPPARSRPRSGETSDRVAPGGRLADGSFGDGSTEEGGVVLERVLKEAERGELGWEIMTTLAELRLRYPETAASRQAAQWVATLSGLRTALAKDDRARARSVLSELVRAGQFGDAVVSARLLSRVSPREEDRVLWRELSESIEARASRALEAEEIELGQFFEKGQPAAALQALVDLRRRFGGTAAYEATLPRYIDASLRAHRDLVPIFRTDETVHLEELAATAFDACRFRNLPPIHYRYLGLQPPIPRRVEALERLVEAFYLERMFEDFLAGAAGKTLEVSLEDSTFYQEGRVIRADGDEVESEYSIEGYTVTKTEPWSKVSAIKKVALFGAVNLSPDGTLGLAYFSSRIGYEEGERRALLRLHNRKDSRDLVAAFIARRRGIPVPEEGFVEYRGWLLTPSARDAAIARSEAAKAEERAQLRELKDLKRAQTLHNFIDYARRERQSGRFELAQRILEEIASRPRFASTPPGAEAREILRDPVLAQRTLVRNGPSTNRLDISILGEGYPVEDDFQEAFLVHANTCIRLLLTEEPFREYQSYLNFHAVQLASRDRGVDRTPTERDTPLDGKVEWDVFSVDRAKVLAILERLGADPAAVVIGNDHAGIQTGGGGVACLAKGGLAAVGHELGHALGGLRDEYDNPAGNDPKRKITKKRGTGVPTTPMPPNLMAGSDRDSVLIHALWRHWIEAGESKWWNGGQVGIFEGGGYSPFNIWRPQANCKMRTSSVNFCVVCMEQMVLALYRRARPIDRVQPETQDVLLDRDLNRVFRVWPLKPQTRFLEVVWTLLDLGVEQPGEDGPTEVAGPSARRGDVYQRVYRTYDPEGRVVEAALVRGTDLRPGNRYRLRVEIRDPTPWVIRDEGHLLEDSREWFLRVRGE